MVPASIWTRLKKRVLLALTLSEWTEGGRTDKQWRASSRADRSSYLLSAKAAYREK